MNLALALARIRLGAPRRRYLVEAETRWVPMRDGVRLATHVLRPRALGCAPAVLIRTPSPAGRDSDPARILAAILAEQGYVAVVQECRGRASSEGVFTPFASEARDGADAAAWVAAQSWFGGRLALLGVGYSGFAAWAASASAEVPVHALVVALAPRSPRAHVYVGGALALEDALQLGVGIGEREWIDPARLDLERGVAHRPVREADRVTLRRVDWYREWVDHPAEDDYWRALLPCIPAEPPPTLLLAGWRHQALVPQLADHAEMCERGAACGLVVGPWGGPDEARAPRANGFARVALRSALEFLEDGLRPEAKPVSGSPVRFLLRGERRWRECEAWPPPGDVLVRHLRGDGGAGRAGGYGRLVPDPPGGDEPADTFTFRPEDPVASHASERAAAAGREDVLCYVTPPLEAPLRLAGARLALYASSDAPDTDFTASLVAAPPAASPVLLCEGILRCRRREAEAAWLTPDTPTLLEIDLGVAGARVEAGTRLRLEVASSRFPRFDRNSNTQKEPALAAPEDCQPARQQVFHDALRPSHLVLWDISRRPPAGS